MDDWLIVGRAALLLAIFGAALLESWLFNRRDIPCLIWTFGLAILVVWIGHPMTIGRLTLSFLVLVGGLVLIRKYYLSASSTGLGSNPDP
jgi:hypothetical protein